MSTLHDLKDKLHRTAGDGADVLADVEHALQDARRKLGSGRERLGATAADTADILREEADGAVRDARRRARRVRKRARRQARTLRGRGGPRPAAVVGGLAGLSALVAALVARRPLGAAAGRGAKAVTAAANRGARACRSRLRAKGSARGGKDVHA